jgi:DNA-binding CsgD family transcriptional regulator
MAAVEERWPFTGREAELHRLLGWLAEGVAAIVVAGPDGAGRSRLIDELGAAARRAGWSTVALRPTRSSTATPMAALAPLAGWPDQTDEPHRRLLMVDDAHLLDDASATVAHQWATGGTAVVVVTVRSGEPAPAAIVALWKEEVGPRLELDPLPEEACDRLLTGALGGPVDRAVVADLTRRTAGNVVFLRELVTAGLADDSLRNEAGLWTAAGPIGPSVRLGELVAAALRGLTAAEAELLDLLAFAGPLGPAELSALTGPPDWTVTAAALERSGLLVSALDGRRLEVRIGRPIHGEVRAARLPAVAARQLAGRLAAAVEAAGARRPNDLLRIGTWGLQVGHGRPEVMLAAAQRAAARFDHHTAEELARAATRAGAGFAAELLAAESVERQGRAIEAEDELAALALTASTPEQQGRIALLRLDNDAFFRGRLDDALRLAENAEAALPPGEWRDHVAARRAGLLLALHGPREAWRVAEPLARQADPEAPPWSVVIASWSLGRLGRLTEAAALAHTHLRHVAPGGPDPAAPTWHHAVMLAEALAQMGRFAEAAALSAEEYARAVAARCSEAQAYFAWQQAKTVGERGHLAASLRLGREAAALFQQMDRRMTLGDALTHLALAQALAGRAADATRTLRTVDALRATNPSWTMVDLVQARGWTSAATGDLLSARAWMIEAADLGESIGDLLGAASALHALARLADPAGALDRLRHLATVVEGDLVSARAHHTEALAANDPERLESAAARFDAMDAPLLTAEARADSAAAWAARGEQRTAAAARRLASVAAARCEGVVTPALQSIGLRTRLTPAERDAALLAAAGRSNREIADQYCLSVRTVEGRLQRVYEKLGISSRSELGAVLAPVLQTS